MIAGILAFEESMAAELRWDDAEDIGIALADKFRDINPLEVRFTDLHRYVTELPTFVDDPKIRPNRFEVWLANGSGGN